MTAARCIELFADEDLQRFIRDEACRRAHDEDLQADCYAAAWAWISSHAPDDMCIEAIMEYVERAIFNEYRRELRQRRLVGKLLDLCIQEDGEIADFESFGHRWDAGQPLDPLKRGRWR